MNVQIFKTFTTQGLYRSIDVFNYPFDYPSLTRILGYRFLFQWKHREPKMIPPHDALVATIKQMVLDNMYKEDTDSKSVLMDLVDILLEFSRKDGDELLEYLQQAKITANNVGPTEDGTECTIYSDSQSVHNQSINNSIKHVVTYLCKNYQPNFPPDPKIKIAFQADIESKLKQLLSDKNDLVDDVLTRIYSDNAVFGGYQADIVLYSLWNWIGNENQKEYASALYDRVAEEINEMHRYCSTRLVSGLVNVMQGFTDDINLHIKMSNHEQCKAVVYTYINKMVQECSDERVLEGFSERNSAFIRFMVHIVNNKRSDWTDEYGPDFADQVSSVVNDYAAQTIFKLN